MKKLILAATAALLAGALALPSVASAGRGKFDSSRFGVDAVRAHNQEHGKTRFKKAPVALPQPGKAKKKAKKK
jgi:hypothetical protein